VGEGPGQKEHGPRIQTAEFPGNRIATGAKKKGKYYRRDDPAGQSQIVCRLSMAPRKKKRGARLTGRSLNKTRREDGALGRKGPLQWATSEVKKRVVTELERCVRSECPEVLWTWCGENALPKKGSATRYRGETGDKKDQKEPSRKRVFQNGARQFRKKPGQSG